MEHNFTVEEVNLICIFAGESKTFTLESHTEVIEEIGRQGINYPLFAAFLVRNLAALICISCRKTCLS